MKQPKFPKTFGPDVSVSDLDLEEEEFYVSGERLTTQHAAQMADSRERRVGRPSLTGQGKHSPSLSLRISAQDRRQLEKVAQQQGRRISDVVREALHEYLAKTA